MPCAIKSDSSSARGVFRGLLPYRVPVGLLLVFVGCPAKGALSLRGEPACLSIELGKVLKVSVPTGYSGAVALLGFCPLSCKDGFLVGGTRDIIFLM